MNGQSGTGPFLIKVGLILVGGLVILFGFTFAIVLAQDGSSSTAAASSGKYVNNPVGSFGIGQLPNYQPIKIDTAAVPQFIANPLKEKRGVILLVYVKGAADSEEMLANFNTVKAEYASQASFFSFEAKDVTEVSDVLDQLQINQPPALAVISADGMVYQLYTGWIGEKVMEQTVANALRE